MSDTKHLGAMVQVTITHFALITLVCTGCNFEHVFMTSPTAAEVHQMSIHEPVGAER